MIRLYLSLLFTMRFGVRVQYPPPPCDSKPPFATCLWTTKKKLCGLPHQMIQKGVSTSHKVVINHQQPNGRHGNCTASRILLP